MRTRIPTVGVFAVASATALLMTPMRGQDPAAEPKAEFVEPTSTEARSYRIAGSYAIDRLVMTMITDSSRAVTGHTEVAALKTFHLKDVPMKNGTVAGLPRITAMKLTSLKLRNPDNAPDAADKLALDYIRLQLDSGTAPQILVQRVALPKGGAEWRVYKPLANIAQCGSCHGNPEDQSPELRQAIEAAYPKDEAKGYATREWRGIIRVTVAPEAPPANPAKASSKN